jgi:hypothetical protein
MSDTRGCRAILYQVWTLFRSKEIRVAKTLTFSLLFLIQTGTGVWDGTEFYSTNTCRSVISGLAPPGFCQQRPDSLSSSTSAAAQTSALGTSSSTIASDFTSVESLPRTSSSVRQPQRTSSARSR